MHTTGQDFASAQDTSSDVRLKTNIADLPSMLDKIMSLRVKTFDKHFLTLDAERNLVIDTSTPPRPSIGLIAQGEVRELFPQLVHGKEGPHEFLGIDSGEVGMVLLATFQEFVRETREEIRALKSLTEGAKHG